MVVRFEGAREEGGGIGRSGQDSLTHCIFSGGRRGKKGWGGVSLEVQRRWKGGREGEDEGYMCTLHTVYTLYGVLYGMLYTPIHMYEKGGVSRARGSALAQHQTQC